VITTKIPPLLVGLGVGIGLYFFLVLMGFRTGLGPLIGSPDLVESPSLHIIFPNLTEIKGLGDLWPLIVGGAFALALVAAIDALLCAKLVSAPGETKVDSDRLLMRLGAANVLSSCVGGITAGINIGPSLTNRAFGGTTSLSALINAGILLLACTVLFPMLSYMPRVVLSATIMVVAVQHVDPWTVDLIHRIRSTPLSQRRLMLLDLFVVAIVALLSVTINIVLAVFLGLAIAILLFLVRMSRSNIRRRYSCDKIHSRKARTPEELVLLEKGGSEILVLELQGVLFFGSAEMLSDDVERASKTGIRTVILDLRRVTEIDVTGARILADIHASLARTNRQIALALSKDTETAARLTEVGIIEAVGAARVFEDIDRAMEWAEDDLIRSKDWVVKSDPLPLARVDLFATLSPEEFKILEQYTTVRPYPRGTTIFHEGEPGKELFLLTSGRVSAYLNPPSGGEIRLATFAPGTAFGELAILDAGPRSATVVADDDVVCHVISESHLSALAKDAPGLIIKLLSGLGRELSQRLRRANATIHQLEA
jgi:SulP family sulfate permease